MEEMQATLTKQINDKINSDPKTKAQFESSIAKFKVALKSIDSKAKITSEQLSELTKSFSDFSENIIPDLFKTIESSTKYLEAMHTDLKTGQTEIKETVKAEANEIKETVVESKNEIIGKFDEAIQMNEKKEQAYLNRETRHILKIDKLKEKNKTIMEQLKNDQLEKDKIIKESKEKDKVIIKKDEVITQKDQVITQKDQVITKKDQVITQKDNALEQERREKEKALEKALKLELYLKNIGVNIDNI